jgi:hypothetical protein
MHSATEQCDFECPHVMRARKQIEAQEKKSPPAAWAAWVSIALLIIGQICYMASTMGGLQQKVTDLAGSVDDIKHALNLTPSPRATTPTNASIRRE